MNVPEPGAEVPTADAIAAVQAGGVFLLDVREDHEWDAVHTSAAHHVPMGAIAGRQDELPTDTDIYVVCHAGSRSRRVTDALVDAGYRAYNVAGGMQAWEATGGPVSKGTFDGR